MNNFVGLEVGTVTGLGLFIFLKMHIITPMYAGNSTPAVLAK